MYRILFLWESALVILLIYMTRNIYKIYKITIKHEYIDYKYDLIYNIISFAVKAVMSFCVSYIIYGIRYKSHT